MISEIMRKNGGIEIFSFLHIWEKMKFRILLYLFNWRRQNSENGFVCMLVEGGIQNFVLEVVRMMLGMASSITHV